MQDHGPHGVWQQGPQKARVPGPSPAARTSPPMEGDATSLGPRSHPFRPLKLLLASSRTGAPRAPVPPELSTAPPAKGAARRRGMPLPLGCRCAARRSRAPGGGGGCA